MSVEPVPNLFWLLFLFGLLKPGLGFFDPCGDRYEIKEEEANAVMENWPRNLQLASVNRTHKCYVSCILWYFGIIDSHGSVSLDEYFDLGIIDEYAFAPTLNRCVYQYRNETDLCERTFGLFHCLRLEKLATV
uniref:Odorant-binding protein 57d n=1 Tax=Drosophila jambulina TaxID=111875 RepID=B0M2F6_DROJA|nr:odorant-binding protein 57d [Drosophila jambulina]